MADRKRDTTRTRAACLLSVLLGSNIAQAANIRIATDPPFDKGTLYASIHAADAPDWNTPLRTLESDEADPMFEGLAPGRYAVQLFIDLNGNGSLDTSPRGFPREPVGFSQNPSLLRGQPDPNDCAFELGDRNVELRVRLYQPRNPVTAK
ncbi:DUF2141 domain-containing protein [Pseudomonas matsuisoli]|uniref:DUF2141 domain-containing protein n=1 Tax=Pseudomonas matsuisoli TaxID=1515666 RepID=A0A917PYJ7_9PSED|nr:DUF2141 domain-containing protein [Pseudomonas matsuisoli]GGJ99526.1 hypothetical protein GCM10009304_26660 [Pseudomonas matsuisoli]